MWAGLLAIGVLLAGFTLVARGSGGVRWNKEQVDARGVLHGWGFHVFVRVLPDGLLELTVGGEQHANRRTIKVSLVVKPPGELQQPKPHILRAELPMTFFLTDPASKSDVWRATAELSPELLAASELWVIQQTDDEVGPIVGEMVPLVRLLPPPATQPATQPAPSTGEAVP